MNDWLERHPVVTAALFGIVGYVFIVGWCWCFG